MSDTNDILKKARSGYSLLCYGARRADEAERAIGEALDLLETQNARVAELEEDNGLTYQAYMSGAQRADIDLRKRIAELEEALNVIDYIAFTWPRGTAAGPVFNEISRRAATVLRVCLYCGEILGHPYSSPCAKCKQQRMESKPTAAEQEHSNEAL